MTFLAALPLLLIITLLLLFRIAAHHALPLAWLAASLLAFGVWGLGLTQIFAYSLLGVLQSFSILSIIFAALLLLNTMKQASALARIASGFRSLSEDARVQLIIISWFFSGFLEGVSGFGAPVALVAPILVSLGFPPLLAASLSLVLNSTAVSFGGAGNPFFAAFNSLEASLAQSGTDPLLFQEALGNNVAVLHASAGSLMPLFAVGILCFFSRSKVSSASQASPASPLSRSRSALQSFVETIPLALFAGFAFTLPYVLVIRFLGAELPSILAGLIGLGVFVPAIRLGFLVPQSVFRFAHTGAKHKQESEGESPAHTTRVVNAAGPVKTARTAHTETSLFRAWLPYLVIAIFLVVSRLSFLPLRSFLESLSLNIPNIFSVHGTSYRLAWGYIPGILPFLPVVLFAQAFFRLPCRQIRSIWHGSLRQVLPAAITLFSALALVRIMLGSEANPHGYAGMVSELAGSIARLAGGGYAFFAPFIGVLGAFVSGSNTVSNILFTSLQFETAGVLALPQQLIVALQIVGGGCGVMISVNNAVAVCTTLQIAGSEGKIIQKNIPAVLLYTTIVCTSAAILLAMQ